MSSMVLANPAFTSVSDDEMLAINGGWSWKETAITVGAVAVVVGLTLATGGVGALVGASMYGAASGFTVAGTAAVAIDGIVVAGTGASLIAGAK